MKQTVAIQGYRASFHEIAARRFFGEQIEITECATFDKVFSLVQEGKVPLGIAAIENTIAGSLLPNYTLLRESPVHIIGEINLHIQMNLIAHPGQKIEQIEEVYSHPIAIQQSRTFFNTYPHIKLIESADTALSVKEIKDSGKKNAAGIGSAMAAQLYGMEILSAGIETNKRNFTRFLALGMEEKLKQDNIFHKPEPNKASLCFELHDEEGSLSSILAILAFFKTSLTKIQSLPIIGQEFEYFFYIDLTFNDYARYQHAVGAIAPLTHGLQILGEYTSARNIE